MLASLIALSLYLALPGQAADSPSERMAKYKLIQAKVAERYNQVVAAPDDRKTYRALLDAGLEQYELTYTRFRFPDETRENILNLKLVLEDMYTLKDTITEKSLPIGLSEKALVNQLKNKKVPRAYRRSAPLVDPWGTPYRFFIFPENGQFKIVSAGSDRKFDKANLSLTAEELRKHPPEVRNPTLADDIVFVDGRNMAKLFDYPERAQAFLYTRCEPADEKDPSHSRCW